MRRLYLAPFGYRDGTRVLFSTALAAGVELQEMLYLTPSPRKLRDAQLLFFSLIGKPALVPPRFATPRQLSRELYERFGSCRLLSNELKLILTQRIATGIRQGRTPALDKTSSVNEVPLSISAGAPKPAVTLGYASALADFITEVKRYLPNQDTASLRMRLPDLLAGFPIPLRRALEACDVLAQYENELAATHWVDDEDTLRETTNYVGSGYRPRVLILDSFVAPDHLEKELIRALVESAETTLALGYGTEGADNSYALAGRFTAFLQSLGRFETKLLTGSRSTEKPPLLYRYNTAEDELAGICRYIRENSANIPLEKIIVTFPRLEDRAPMVSRIFRQYEIPFTIYPETRLSSSPPIVAVLELLRAIDRDYERIATAAAFSSPFLPELLSLPDEEHPQGRISATQALNYYSRRAGIIKGSDRWKDIAKRILPTDDSRTNMAEAEFLTDIQNRIRKAIGLVDAILEPAGSIGQQARRLKQFLETVKFCRELEPSNPLAAYLITDRGELYDLLDALVSFERDFGAIPKSRSEFIRTISFLTNARLRQADRDAGGVTVISMHETLGISPDMIFLAGLSESELPGTYRADPILPDRVRTELGLPDMTWHRDWQKFNFFRTLYSSANKPFLSFHTSRDGQPLLPTPFLEAEIVSAPSSKAIHSRREQQLLQGRNQGILFADIPRVVDFREDETVKHVLQQRFGPAYAFSVTGLEEYRRCPFRHYVERVLKLSAITEPEFAVDARQWGTIVHAALSRLYENGQVPLSKVEETARSALKRTLDSIDLPEFWQEVTRQIFENLLPRLVELETELRREGFSPARIESELHGKVTDDITVWGRLDRVDESSHACRILDYKTGAADINAKEVLENRTHIQLPLYAHLLIQDDRFREKRVDNIGVYSLRDLKIRWLADATVSVDSLIKATLKTAIEVVQSIRSGDFRPLPASKETCRDCTLSFTCGRKEHQAQP